MVKRILLTLRTLLTHSPSARRQRCRNPKCHLTRKRIKPAQVAKVVNTERERQGKTPKLKVCPSWPLYQPSPQSEKGPDFAGSESALEYALVYEEPEVNSNITSAAPNTSLDLDEQQLIEPNISNDLLELPRAFDRAYLPDEIFDRRSGSESGSFANNVLEDFTRRPAVATSSPSPENTYSDFSRPDVSHKPDYSRPDLVSSSSIHLSGVVLLSNSNESFALPTNPSVLPGNINNDFARPEHVSQKLSRSTDEI
jgi:hypothetical protein